MISDVLFEMCEGIDSYLADGLYDEVYTNDCRKRILRLRDEAKQLQTELDDPSQKAKNKGAADKGLNDDASL